MAHLRGLPVVIILLLFASEARSARGRVDLQLYDRPVQCDVQTELCYEPGTDYILVPEELQSRQVFISTQSSRHAPEGLYIYIEVWRPHGEVALVEVDVSTRGGGAILSYQEYRGDTLVFRSAAATGTLEVPADLLNSSAAACPCRDGRLELLFVGTGPDGVLGTEDDQRRRISRARYTVDQAGHCLAVRMLEVTQDVRVLPLGDCVPASHSGGYGVDHDYSYDGSDVGYDVEAGCYAEGPVYEEDPGCGYDPGPDDGYDGYGGYDSGDEDYGCGGDVADDEYEDTGCDGGSSSEWGDSSSSGCDSGSSSEWGDSSSSGCDGGSSSDWGGSSSSGCEGDSASSGASCEGDAWASVHPPRRSKKRNRVMGMLGPLSTLVLFCLVLKRPVRRRRWRRRRAVKTRTSRRDRDTG